MKFKIIKRSIKDAEIDHVIELANYGMSRKMIAKEAYGTNGDGEPTNSSLMRINHILRDYGVRVTDYRNGRNKHGKAMIVAIRRETNILDAIRVASKEMRDLVARKVG